MYKYVLDWMAHVVQKPWIKLQTVLVFIGPAGCGKTSAVEPFFNLFGTNAVLLESLQFMTSHFNSLSQDKILVFLEELKVTKKSDLSVFKNAVTGKKRRFEKKYSEASSSTDYSHYIACSDDPNSLTFQDKNRRYALVDCGSFSFSSETQKIAYFNRYFAAMEQDEGYVSCAFYHFLLCRDLTGFNVAQEPPRSKLCEMLQVADENSVSAWWRACLDRGYHCLLSEIMDENNLGLQNFTSKRGRCTERWENKWVFGECLDPKNMPLDYNPWIEEISQEDLYNNYKKWCEENGIKAQFKVNWLKNLGWFIKIISSPRHRIKTSANPNSLRNYYQIDSWEKCTSHYNGRVDKKIERKRDASPKRAPLDFIEIEEDYVPE